MLNPEQYIIELMKANLRKKLKDDKNLVRQLEGRKEGEEGNLFILNPNKIIDKLSYESVKVFRSNTSPFLMTYKSTLTLNQPRMEAITI